MFSPFIIANSGPPFNITTGRDTNLDRQYNERPSFAATGADCNSVNIRCTRFGTFNLVPNPGEQIIPRNYGQGPGAFSVNLRISRTFGFGGEARKSASSSKQGGQKTTAETGKRGEGGAMGGRGGPMINVGGGGGKGPGGGGDHGGGGNMMMGGAGAGAASKYTMTFSVNFQNLFNHVNLGTPYGNLSSPLFGQSLGLGGNFGFFGGPGGGFGGGNGAGNRKVTLSARFNF